MERVTWREVGRSGGAAISDAAVMVPKLMRCSDSKRFPFQEEGRGVVRAWAEWVVGTGSDAAVDPEA
jgi:hypothetical protein